MFKFQGFTLINRRTIKGNHTGFTLIELLITISIIAVLSAIGLIVYTEVLQQGRDSKRQTDLRTIQSALEQYYHDQGYYPVSLNFNGSSSLSAGSRTYMSTIPKDPISSPNYCYKPLKLSQNCSLSAADCSNSGAAADKCVSYCLYAKLDNQSPGSDSCVGVTTYNLKLTPP